MTSELFLSLGLQDEGRHHIEGEGWDKDGMQVARAGLGAHGWRIDLEGYTWDYAGFKGRG